MNLRQFGNTARTTVLQVHHIASLHMTFNCAADFDAHVGTPVRLNSSGAIVKCLATEKPIGIVHIKRNLDHIGKPCVGVLTHFTAEIIGKSNGVIAIGAEVTVSSSTEGDITYKAAATNDFVIGVALSAGVDTADVTVGQFGYSYKK